MTWLLLALACVGYAAWVAVRARLFPYGPCPRCRGRRGKGIGSTSTAWSKCGQCKGSGTQVRLVARLLYPNRCREL